MNGEAQGKRVRKGGFLRAVFWILLIAVMAFLIYWRYEDYRRKLIESSGLPIRPVYQYDYGEAVCVIGGQDKSVASSGCGATCMSMVIEYLTGNERQSPQALFERAYENGDYYGDGLSHGAIDRLGLAYDVEGVWIRRSEDQLRGALEAGYPVIAHMGPGTFTRSGHYILLRGLTEDGRAVVNDPNSETRSYQTYDLSLIVKEAKTDAPFMVCRSIK